MPQRKSNMFHLFLHIQYNVVGQENVQLQPECVGKPGGPDEELHVAQTVCTGAPWSFFKGEFGAICVRSLHFAFWLCELTVVLRTLLVFQWFQASSSESVSEISLTLSESSAFGMSLIITEQVTADTESFWGIPCGGCNITLMVLPQPSLCSTNLFQGLMERLRWLKCWILECKTLGLKAVGQTNLHVVSSPDCEHQQAGQNKWICF